MSHSGGTAVSLSITSRVMINPSRPWDGYFAGVFILLDAPPSPEPIPKSVLLVVLTVAVPFRIFWFAFGGKSFSDEDED